MNQISSEKLFSVATLILGIWLVIKLFWVIVEYMVLPLEGVNINTGGAKSNLNYRYKFATNVQQIVKPQPTTPTKIEPKLPSLDDYKLVGIYVDDEDVIVTLNKSGKSFILSKGDNIDGYVLVGGKIDEAYFKKDKKKYSVKMQKKSTLKSSAPVNPPPKGISPTGKGEVDLKDKPSNEKVPGEVRPDGGGGNPSNSGGASKPVSTGPKSISRASIDNYMENPTKLRSDIGLRAVAKDGSIVGYKVRFVRSSSPLGSIGLKRGDIIKSVNGEDVSNPAAAMGALKNIKNADSATIRIIRENQEKELEYEIK